MGNSASDKSFMWQSLNHANFDNSSLFSLLKYNLFCLVFFLLLRKLRVWLLWNRIMTFLLKCDSVLWRSNRFIRFINALSMEGYCSGLYELQTNSISSCLCILRQFKLLIKHKKSHCTKFQLKSFNSKWWVDESTTCFCHDLSTDFKMFCREIPMDKLKNWLFHKP